jgi:hypothetical protein
VGVNQRDASTQNIETDEVAVKVHVMKANNTDSAYRPQANCGNILQKCTSFSNNSATPAEEHAAANDKIAVT